MHRTKVKYGSNLRYNVHCYETKFSKHLEKQIQSFDEFHKILNDFHAKKINTLW